VEFAQLQLGFMDRTQWRYKAIRPLVLFADRTPQQRAHETHTHPDTVRALQRRFRQQGMPGLLPENAEVVVRKRTTRIPEAVRLEIDRLEEGLPQTQVLLWVSGEQLRAAFDHVILTEYHCRYDWRDRYVKAIRQGVFYPTRFASPQGMLIPLTPQNSVVVYRARSPRRRTHSRPSVQQLVLFAVVPPG